MGTFPWDAVFLEAGDEETLWTERVQDVAFLYKAALKSRATLADRWHDASLPGAQPKEAGTGRGSLSCASDPSAFMRTHGNLLQ